MYKKTISTLAGITYFLFGSDKVILNFVYAVFIFITFDIVTGIIKAKFFEKNFNSGVFEYGIIKKITILISISLCYFVDLFHVFPISVNLETVACTFFITGELLSIVDNIKATGQNLPQQLLDLVIKGGNNTDGK